MSTHLPRIRPRSWRIALASVLLGSSVAAAETPAARRPAPIDVQLPPRAIVVLVASWCAPCRGELARLDTIADAARGWTLRVLAVDDSVATRRMLRGVDHARVWDPGAQADGVRAALLARTAGLPFSVVTDARGAICAQENGGLDATRTAALVRRCAAP